MKRPNTLILILYISIFVGCVSHRRIESLEDVTVEPGVGVSGLCELGMTVSDIQKCMDDFRLIAWSPAESCSMTFFGIVPSLGAILYLEEGEPLRLIEFRVAPFKIEVIQGLNISNPFRGKIKNSVVFTDKGVTKNEVTNHHGRIELQAISYVDEATRKGKPFSVMFPNDEEELWYLEQGIKFTTVSNVVVSFSIYPRKSVDRQEQLEISLLGMSNSNQNK